MPTSKLFVFARAREGVAASALVDWFTHALNGAPVQPRRYVLNICDVVPVYRIAPFIAAKGNTRPAYDVGAELWFDGPASASTSTAKAVFPMDAPELQRLADTVHAYQVEEKVLYTPAPGTPVDIKFMALGRWLPHLSDAEGRQHWTEHAKLVPKVHVGVNRYVQNWVTGASPADAPRVTGIAELHFPSVQSLGDDFYNSAEGQAEIRADVSRFTEGATTLCVRARALIEG